MEEKKYNINVTPKEGQEVMQVAIYEGKAPDHIAPMPPMGFEIYGIINAPLEFLKKRLETGQFKQTDCHIIVNRDKVTITLYGNERDYYKRFIVDGELKINTKFVEFGINTGKTWTPTELGLFFKMNRAFFANRADNMKLVTDLMNFTATINCKVDRSVQENGNRTDNFVQMVNSNLPPAFNLLIPIFKGMKPEAIEVETFARVDGRDVSFVLMSPGAQATFEEIRDKVIDEQLEAIRAIAPDIAIIEV